MCVCVCHIVKWSERGKVKEGKREIKGMRERGEKERRERESLIIGRRSDILYIIPQTLVSY